MSRLLWVSCCAVFVAFGFWCGPAEAAEIIAEQNFDAIPDGTTSQPTSGTNLGFTGFGTSGTVGVSSGQYNISNTDSGNNHNPDPFNPPAPFVGDPTDDFHALQFDPVNLSGFQDVMFSMDWQAFNDGDWEDVDLVQIRLLLDDGNSLDTEVLVDTTGIDIDGTGVFTPQNVSFMIPNDKQTATLEIFGDTSSGTELLAFDNIVFQGRVPEPASVAIWTLLGAVAGLFVWRRRRRNRS